MQGGQSLQYTMLEKVENHTQIDVRCPTMYKQQLKMNHRELEGNVEESPRDIGIGNYP